MIPKFSFFKMISVKIEVVKKYIVIIKEMVDEY